MTAKRLYILFFTLLFSGIWGDNPAMAKGLMDFSIKSADITSGERIERPFTCEGEDISPGLHWEGIPEGTKSLVLIAEDPDAPMGTFIHWVLYDIPAAGKGLERGASGTKALVAGGAREGVSSFGKKGYNGPCPPTGHGEHRYYFRLWALDIEGLEVGGRATKADVEAGMSGHVLAETSIMGTYSR